MEALLGLRPSLERLVGHQLRRAGRLVRRRLRFDAHQGLFLFSQHHFDALCHCVASLQIGAISVFACSLVCSR
jgi:hypothetical protein